MTFCASPSSLSFPRCRWRDFSASGSPNRAYFSLAGSVTREFVASVSDALRANLLSLRGKQSWRRNCGYFHRDGSCRWAINLILKTNWTILRGKNYLAKRRCACTLEYREKFCVEEWNFYLVKQRDTCLFDILEKLNFYAAFKVKCLFVNVYRVMNTLKNTDRTLEE